MLSGKHKILQKDVEEMSGNFTFQPDEARMFGPRCIYNAKFIKFVAPYCQGNLNLCQGHVREFWSVLNV